LLRTLPAGGALLVAGLLGACGVGQSPPASKGVPTLMPTALPTAAPAGAVRPTSAATPGAEAKPTSVPSG